MEYDSGDQVVGKFVVLSADPACFERVRRLWRSGWASLVWISDPRSLEDMLARGESGGIDPSTRKAHVLGIVLDLTPPMEIPNSSVPYASRATNKRPEASSASASIGGWLAWYLAAMLAAMCYGKQAALLLISSDAGLDRLLHRHAIYLVGRIEPTDADNSWQRALTRLYTHISQSDLNESDAYTTRRGQTSSEVSVVRLAPHVYFDLSRWVVLREGEEIELTRRQAAVLAILAETPNTYRSTSELAHRVSTSRLYPVEEHSIEQTICALRRKLGESAKDARLIQGRRGLGYALMVEEDTRLASVGVVAYASVLAHG